MIAFASLFLGLILGPRPVEIVVGDEVAAVELLLDGRSLGVLTEPPWRFAADFGSELAPQRLEAVAFDARRRELGRVSQWLNLPQPRAVISALLEPRQPGEPRIARLSWESIAGAQPEAVNATLDGAPLAVEDPHRIALPAVDESQLHLLQIEMRFEGRVTSRVDITFGGAYADEVSTEMTALAISALRADARPPTAGGARGWFLKDGEPLEVIAIDKGSAEVVVVMGRPFPHFVAPRSAKRPKLPPLARDHRLRFVSPVSEETAGVATTFNLFPISPPYGRETGDLYELLTGLFRLPEKTRPRPEAAVAVAGLAAYEGRRRRAVVLIPDSRPSIDDDLTPAQVERYLERLRIPFLVWDPEARHAPQVAAWGEVRSVGDPKQLAAAYEELSDRLDRQWIVWIDGRHLPQDIALSPDVRDFVLTR